MTRDEIEVLQDEYLVLQEQQTTAKSSDELAAVTHRMGEILSILQDAGVDTYPTIVRRS